MADKAKVLADRCPTASPVPVEKSADFEMDGQREFSKFSLPVGGGIGVNTVAERLSVTLDFEDVGTTRKTKNAAEASEPHTPSESPRHFAAEG